MCSVSTLYCMTVSLAHDGAGIGAMMREPKVRELAQSAGLHQFNRLTVKDAFSVLYELRLQRFVLSFPRVRPPREESRHCHHISAITRLSATAVTAEKARVHCGLATPERD